MISAEMNLATDLGVDSIKRVVLLGAVPVELNIKVTDLDALSRAKLLAMSCKTVGDVAVIKITSCCQSRIWFVQTTTVTTTIMSCTTDGPNANVQGYRFKATTTDSAQYEGFFP